jgi:hypothetical protein
VAQDAEQDYWEDLFDNFKHKKIYKDLAKFSDHDKAIELHTIIMSNRVEIPCG